MLRAMTCGLHLLLAAMTGSGALIWLVQARLNLAWELAFYGEGSLVTSTLLASTALLLVLASLQAIASLAFALRQRWGGWTLMGISAVLLCNTPSPVFWLIAASGFSIAVILVRDAVEARLPPPDDEDAP